MGASPCLCGLWGEGAVALRPGLLPVSDVRLGRGNGAADAVFPPGSLGWGLWVGLA